MKIRNLLLTLTTLALFAPAAYAATEMNFTTSMTSTHPVIANGMLPYWNGLAEETKAFKVTYFEPGTLVPVSEQYNALLKGIVSNTMFSLSKYKNSFPISSLIDLPNPYSSAESAALAFTRLFHEFPEIQKEFTKVYPSALVTSVPSDLLSIKPIKNLADMQGKRVGVLNGGAADTVKALGATPILLPMSDMYTSLQRGMLDAVLMPIPAFKSTKVTEVAKYLLDGNLTVNSAFVLLSQKFVKSLDVKTQEVFSHFSNTPEFAAFVGAWVDSSAKKDLQFVIANDGVEVTPFPEDERAEWNKRLAPLFGEWENAVKKAGADPNAIRDSFYKWLAFYADENNVKEVEKSAVPFIREYIPSAAFFADGFAE